MDEIKDNLTKSSGLIGSGIGVWWVKKVDGEFYYFHTQSSCDVYGYSLEDLKPSVIHGEAWLEIATKVYELDPTYKGIIEDTIVKFKSIMSGELESCTYSTPWLDAKGNHVYVEDQVFLIDKDTDGTALTVVGTTTNISLRKKTQIELANLEQGNRKLLEANERAVDFANLLVWSMNFEEYPEGDYVFSNSKYKDTLGIQANELGLTSFEDFLSTTYPDEQGKSSMNNLVSQFETMQNNETSNYVGFVVKHQNILTKEVLYLEHFTRVETRFENGEIKLIGGVHNKYN